jgi:hypothetical protein
MKSVTAARNSEADRSSSVITTDRVLKLTSYLLEGVVLATEGLTRDHESRFLQCLYYAFPDLCLHDLESDSESRLARIEAESEPSGGEFEEEDLETFDESMVPATADEKVVLGRMDAEDARAFVEMLNELLDDMSRGERLLSVKSLAAVHALRCQLLAPQGESSNSGPNTITFSRWLIDEIDRFTGVRGMARILRGTFSDPQSAESRSANDLLRGELVEPARSELITALNDVLDAPGMEVSESGCVIEAAVCLLS